MTRSSNAEKSLPEITKREAILMVHIGEHFPTGFVEEDVAISLGWSLEEVQDARRLCAAHGFLAEQADPLEICDSSPGEAESASAADLLNPEEMDAARKSEVAPHGFLTVGEELSVLRALAAGKQDDCFTEGEADEALLALENEGVVLRGTFTPGSSEREWCDRRLLARIHRYTLNRLRAEIEPVSAADFMRFLFSWQHVNPGLRRPRRSLHAST